MPNLPEAVLQLAEDLNLHLPPSPSTERRVTDGYALCLADGSGPAFTVVQRLRLTPERVAPAVDEVRALLRARGRTEATWEVGASATPGDVRERLLALGMVPFEEPLARGMVLARTPDGPASPVLASRATSLEDHAAALRILGACFGAPPEPEAELRRRAERSLAEESGPGAAGSTWLAWLGGEPVAASKANFARAGLVLGGAGTLPHARGRGAYQALVRARYQEALERGTPVLVTQAGRMSHPILLKLGFEEVVAIHILHDAFAA